VKTAVSAVLLVLAAVAVTDWTSIGPHGGPIHCGAVAAGATPTVHVASTNTSYPLLKTTDLGESWTTAGANLTNYPRALVAHPTDPDRLYGIVSSTFYRTTNGGASWLTSSLGANTNGNDIAINPQNPEVIYVVCYKYDGSAWKPTSAKSTNGGQTWVTTQLDTLTSSTMYSYAIDPVDTNVVYMGGYVNGQTVVYKTTDCGATWTPYGLPANHNYVYSLLVCPVNRNLVLAGTLNGICRSTDGGVTWTQMNQGLVNHKVLMLALRPGAENTLFAGTEGGSVFRTSISTGLSSPSSLAPRPSPLTLSPNPCRDLATISLDSSLLSPHSSVSIYNASGRLVQSLPIRTSSFALRTSDFPPGAYFVRLNNGTEPHTTRLTIAD